MLTHPRPPDPTHQSPIPFFPPLQVTRQMSIMSHYSVRSESGSVLIQVRGGMDGYGPPRQHDVAYQMPPTFTFLSHNFTSPIHLPPSEGHTIRP